MGVRKHSCHLAQRQCLFALQAWPLRHYKLLWLGHNLSGCNDHLGRELRRDLVEGEEDVAAGGCWLALMKPIH